MSPSYKRRTQIMKNLINAVAFNPINTVIPCAKRAKEKSSSARPLVGPTQARFAEGLKGHVNPKVHVFLELCKKWRRKRI